MPLLQIADVLHIRSARNFQTPFFDPPDTELHAIGGHDGHLANQRMHGYPAPSARMCSGSGIGRCVAMSIHTITT